MKQLLSVLMLALFVAGCSSSPKRELAVNSLSDQKDGLVVEQRWSVNTGRGMEAVGDALVPAVDGDRVYVADHRGRLSGYSLNSGSREWRMDIDGTVSGGPAVQDGLLVVGTRNGRVVAVDLAESRVRWTTSVSSEVLSVPTFGPDQVLVMSGDSRLFSLRMDTGARRWVYDRAAPPLTLRGTSSPQVAGDNVLVGLSNGRLVAVQMRNGNQAWEADVGVASGSSDLERMRDVDGDPVIRDNTVYVVGYQGRAMSLDLERGRSNWNRDLSSFSGLDVDGERMYVTESNGRVWALDRRTGASVWRQDQLEGIRGSAPVVVGDVVVVGDDRGRLTFMDISDGSILARIRYGDGISRAPVAVDGDLLVLTDDGRLLRLGLSRPD